MRCAGDDRFGVVNGTLGTVGTTNPGEYRPHVLRHRRVELASTVGLSVRIGLETHEETVDTFNVLADTSGRADRTVVVGGHLDSVTEGPGINDNGAGSVQASSRPPSRWRT